MALLLIIEDDDVLRENTKSLLELHGYEVAVAADGNEGLALLQILKPDLIICDIMMPGINGFEVKSSLNQIPELASIPFIFLTGKTAESAVNMGMSLGASAFITKPFKVKEVIVRINELLTINR